MALFTAFVIAGTILTFNQFMEIATNNIILNGIIIGTIIFGVGLSFSEIFKLLPEYRWIKKFFYENKKNELPPRLFRPVAMILQNQDATNKKISTTNLGNLLELILGRFEDQRESLRYITNTLIFMGLLGTFWGLIHTVGGFAELVGGLNFEDENIMTTLQSGLIAPMSGMGTAFSSSLFGLAGSLIIGFLGLQVQLAQNSLYRELEENLSKRAQLIAYKEEESLSDNIIPSINLATKELTQAVQNLEKTVAKMI